VLPVVLTLFLGIFEFGFIWKDDLAIANGVHSAVRVGAADGTNQYADYDIIQQLKTATGLPSTAIRGVIVWKADTGSNAKVPQGCKDLVGQPSQGLSAAGGVLCNYYSSVDVQNASSTTRDTMFTAACTGLDSTWCGSTRNNSLAGPGPDLVGVYVQINHNYVTKIFGTSRTMSDQAVMRIEPQ